VTLVFRRRTQIFLLTYLHGQCFHYYPGKNSTIYTASVYSEIYETKTVLKMTVLDSVP